MATFYSRDLAGAPTLTFSATTGPVSSFNNLKLILKACLVTGFGSQPAAGWELINEGTNFIVLRNGSHTGYVCLTNVIGSNGFVSVYVGSTYTGMSGDVMTGDGVKSGAASGSTIPQKMDIRYAQYYSANSSWCLVADTKTFVLDISVSTNSVVVDLTATGGNQGSLWYVGEDSNGWFVAIGGENSAGTPGQWFSSTGMTVLRNPATGLLVGSDTIVLSTPVMTDQAQSFSINVVMPEIEMARFHWIGGGVYGGRLRGMALPAVLARHIGAYAAYMMGVASYNARNASNPIPLGDSYTWVLAYKTTSSCQVMMTTNPDFW